jgi:hypothetical protein
MLVKPLLARLLGNPRIENLPPDRCVFCKIILRNHDDSKTILYEDEQCVVFPDRKPAAVAHFQVVSRKHIINVDALEANEHDRRLGTMPYTSMYTVKSEFVKRRHTTLSFYPCSPLQSSTC